MQGIRAYYNVAPLISSGYRGRGVTVAVVSWSVDATFQDDIRNFDRAYGLPNANVTIITPLGSNGTVSQSFEETTADVELVHAMAPDAKILVLLVGADKVSKGMSYAIDNNVADIVTYSGYEWRWGAGALQWTESYNAELANSVAKNITLLTTSGNFGSNNTVPEPWKNYTFWTQHLPNAFMMPTYSPYATVVGGTQLVIGSKGIVGEAGWNVSGGGPSNLFPQPSWQAAPGVPDNGHRDIPDISLDASCETLYLVYWNGGPYGFCGTSAGAPVFAGVVADLEQAAGHRLGFLNPSLYALASSDPSAFHDVTTGYSLVKTGNTIEPGYCATKGWDFVTGLGSPDAVKLLRYFAPNAAINSTAESQETTGTTSSATNGICPPKAGNGESVPIPSLVAATGVAVVLAILLLVWQRRRSISAAKGNV